MTVKRNNFFLAGTNLQQNLAQCEKPPAANNWGSQKHWSMSKKRYTGLKEAVAALVASFRKETQLADEIWASSTIYRVKMSHLIAAVAPTVTLLRRENYCKKMQRCCTIWFIFFRKWFNPPTVLWGVEWIPREHFTLCAVLLSSHLPCMCFYGFFGCRGFGNWQVDGGNPHYFPVVWLWYLPLSSWMSR